MMNAAVRRARTRSAMLRTANTPRAGETRGSAQDGGGTECGGLAWRWRSEAYGRDADVFCGARHRADRRRRRLDVPVSRAPARLGAAPPPHPPRPEPLVLGPCRPLEGP